MKTPDIISKPDRLSIDQGETIIRQSTRFVALRDLLISDDLTDLTIRANFEEFTADKDGKVVGTRVLPPVVKKVMDLSFEAMAAITLLTEQMQAERKTKESAEPEPAEPGP